MLIPFLPSFLLFSLSWRALWCSRERDEAARLSALRLGGRSPGIPTSHWETPCSSTYHTNPSKGRSAQPALHL